MGARIMTIDPPRQRMSPLDYDQRACDRDELMALLSRVDSRIQAMWRNYREPANEDVFEVLTYLEHIAVDARRSL